MKKNKGITLISLVITIIVLLILSTISIRMLTGNSSIIKNAGNAKENTEIKNEKEIVEKSTVQAMGKSKYGNIIKKDLTEKLNLYAGEEKPEVIEDGDKLEVTLIETNRYYQVSSEGNIEAIKVTADQYAGDITKNNKYNGDTIESAYRISCIEDLVSFSNMSANNTFLNKYIVLTRDLDFKSRLSYNNYNTQEFGDINNDGIVNGLMEEMTLETGSGFKPIGSDLSHFGGTFTSIDDNIKVIKNIYQSTSNSLNAGLFKNTENAKIQKIGLTGKIISSNYAGGLLSVDNSNTQIINCYNSCIIDAKDGNSINRWNRWNCWSFIEYWKSRKLL